MKALDKISKARAQLIMSQPFFGSLALKMQVIENPEIDTMATDGKNLYYKESFVDGLSVPVICGVIAHEVMHCAMLHPMRKGNRDHQKANMAMDYAINPIVTDAGFELPDGALNEPAYAGESFESIYDKLPDPPKDESGGGGFGEVLDYPGEDGKEPTLAEVKQAEQEWKISTVQAATLAKRAGNLPGSLQRIVDDMLDPKLPWSELLRNFIFEVAKNDYSWTRPNRRFIGQGHYLPSLHSQAMGTMVAVVDNSCSLIAKQLNQTASEINEIKEQINPKEFYVLYCDTAVNEVVMFGEHEPVTLELKIGGGTDFRPPFEWVEKNGINPACLVYFTDLYCSSYPNEPNYPVLWVTDSDESMAGQFGETIYIK